MHMAARRENLDALRFIYKHTENIDPLDEYGDTPLHYLITELVLNHEKIDEDTKEVIKFFVENGADISFSLKEAEGFLEGELTDLLKEYSKK
jgi:ankyrin repeat protein